jgi:hypothetical protein
VHCVHSETLMHKRCGEKKIKEKKTVKSFIIYCVHSKTLIHKRYGKSYRNFSISFRVFYNNIIICIEIYFLI